MQKAQGALEYLLLIGGAVLVAVVVITLILGLTDTAGTETETTVGSAFDVIRAAREGGAVGPPGGTETIVTATLIATKYPLYRPAGFNCNTSGDWFCTITDYLYEDDYAGLLNFSISPAIPSAATINSATLRLYHYTSLTTNCFDTDPLYFYIDTLSTFNTCTSAVIPVNNTEDSRPPSGENAISYPTPNTCTPAGYRTFQIANAIEKNTTNLIIRVHGNDIDNAGNPHYRCFYGASGANAPTLEITYTV